MRLWCQKSDADLVGKALADQPDAFEGLVLRYQKKAFAIARSVGVRRGELDDVVQEAFLRGWRELRSLRVPASFGAWLLQIVRNAAREHLLKRPLPQGSPSGSPGPEAGEASPAEAADTEDFHEYLWRKVMELPEGVREAVFLYYHDGESTWRVSRTLGISRSLVKYRLQQGRKLLRERLWREMEGCFRTLSPSSREWKRRGRSLALVAFLSVPPVAAPRAPAAAATGAIVLGGLMTAKKAFIAACIAFLLLMGSVPLAIGLLRERAQPPGGALARKAPPTAPPLEPAPVEATAAIDELPPPVDLDAADRDRDLFGIVTDAEGRAVAGARVETLFHDGRRLSLNDLERFWQVRAGPSTRSAVDGTFLLRLERGEAVELVITHPGFARCALAQRQAGELVEAVLAPASRLEVLARDEDGAPASSVRLRLWRHDHTRPGGSVFCERDGATDDGGRFVFEDLEAGKLTLSLEHAVLGSPNWQFPEVAAGDTLVLEVVMPRGRTIRGRVTDVETGEPIAKALVGANWTLDRRVPTDASGAYAFPGWTGEGVEDLHVTADGYGRQGKLVPPGGDVDFALERGDRATGRLLDASKKPIAGAHVTAIASRLDGERGQEIDARSAVTRADGRFVLTSLRRDLPHTLVVLARGHGHYLLDFDHELAEEGSIDLGDMVLPMARSIEGVATDARRRPIPGATVVLAGENGDRGRLRGASGDTAPDSESAVQGGYGREESRRTDDLGRFRFPDLSPGAYSLTLRAHGFPDVATAVDLAGDRDLLDVKLSQAEGISIRIRVTDSGGSPVAGVKVETVSPVGDRVSRTTDAAGRAELGGLAGSLTRLVISPGNEYLTPKARDETPHGQEVVIVLEEAAPIDGLLLSPDGEALAEHEVYAVLAGGDEVLASNFSDGEGRFQLRVRPGTRVDLKMTGVTSGRLSASVEELRGELRGVTAPADGVSVSARRIALDRWMVVEVLDPDGRPVAGAALQCWWGAAAHGRREAKTDEAGQARLEDLPPEQVTVDVDIVEAPQPIATVPEGQTIQLRLGRGAETEE